MCCCASCGSTAELRMGFYFPLFCRGFVLGKCTPKWPGPNTLRDLRVRKCSFWSFWDTFRLINQGPGLPPLARSANVGPFNTAVGGPQRACKLPLEVLHPRAFPSKGGPEGRSGGGLAQGCNLNLERPRTCGRRPFGAGVGETGTRESHLGGPLGSSNGRIEWNSVGRPGQRWQTGPLNN